MTPTALPRSCGWSLAGGAAAAALIWLMPSSGWTDAFIGLAFVLALFRWKEAAGLWLSPAGLACLLLALFPLVQLPWAQDPGAAAGDLARDVRLPAGVFALSVFVTGGRRIDRALLLSALVVLPVFAVDLVRLIRALGPDFPALARYYKPQFLNHPNVSSMLAGASCLICLYGAWTRRTSPWKAAGLAAGAGLALLYLFVMASRGPQAAFAAAAGCAFLIVPRTWKGRAAGLILLIAAAVLIGLNLERLNKRFLDRSDFLSGREAVWSHTVKLIRERPWFGYGYGKQIFQDVYAGSHPPPSPHRFPHPHQETLFVLFQGGRAWLILHLAFGVLLAVRMARALRAAEGETDRLRLALLALLLVQWIIYGLGDYPDNRLRLALAALAPLALAASDPKAGQADSTRTLTSG